MKSRSRDGLAAKGLLACVAAGRDTKSAKIPGIVAVYRLRRSLPRTTLV